MTESISSNAPVYTLIKTNQALADFCRCIRDCERMTVDTEFVGEKYYFPKLEVIQLGALGKIAIVDCDAVSDLTPIRDLFENSSILKIFHAGGIDWELLLRATGVLPLPVFDTQIAAAFLGYGAQISHTNLVKAITGVELSGKQTTSDWSARPLTPQQLHYAALDVHHLESLYANLVAALKERDRYGWFLDEQQRRVERVSEEADDSGDLFRRVKDWASLSGRELAVLQQLALWREEQAIERNLPRRMILTDDGMLELARFQPSSKDKALKLRRVNGGQIARQFDELHKVIERAKKIPREEWPKKGSGERIDLAPGVLEVCQAVLRSEADHSGVAASMIATTADVTRLITKPEDDENPLLQGWRRELAGQRLLDLIAGRLAIRITVDRELELVPLNPA